MELWVEAEGGQAQLRLRLALVRTLLGICFRHPGVMKKLVVQKEHFFLILVGLVWFLCSASFLPINIAFFLFLQTGLFPADLCISPAW